jgi:CHAT domain-containing protein
MRNMRFFCFILFIILNSYVIGQDSVEVNLKIEVFKKHLNEDNLSAAKPIGLEILKNYEQDNQSLNHDELDIVWRTGATCISLGDTTNWLKVSQFGFEKSSELYGESHPISLLFLNNILVAHFLFEDYLNCANVGEQYLKLQGKNYNDKLAFLKLIAESYDELGNNVRRNEIYAIWIERELEFGITDEEYFDLTINLLKASYFYLQNYDKCLKFNSILINRQRSRNEPCKISKSYSDQANYYLSSHDRIAAKIYLDSAKNTMTSSCSAELDILYIEFEYLQSIGQADSAINRINQLISLVGNGIEFKYNKEELEFDLLMLLMSNAYLEKSYSLIEKVLDSINYNNPSYYDFLFMKCELNNMHGLYNETIKELTDIKKNITNSPENEVAINFTLGETYSLIGNFHKSNSLLIPLLSKIDTTKTSWDNSIYSSVIPLIAINHVGINKHEFAIDIYSKYNNFLYENHFYEELARLTTPTGLAFLCLGDFSKGYEVLKRGEKLNYLLPQNKHLRIATMGSISYYHLLNKEYEKCIEYNSEIIEFYAKNNQFQLANALFNSSESYFALGNIHDLKITLERAFRALSSHYSKTEYGLSDNQRLAHKEMIDSYLIYAGAYVLKMNEIPKFFSDFWYNYNGAPRIILSRNEQKLKQRYQIKKIELNSLIESNSSDEKRINKLISEIEELESKLSFSSKSSTSTRTINRDHIVDNLADDEVLIDIISIPLIKWLGGKLFPDKDSIIYLALINPSNSKEQDFVYLENGELLESEILYNYISQNTVLRNTANIKDELSYEYFWKPIADKIGDTKTVYVSLGGVYNNINLNTLYNTETGKYLFEEKDIRIVNSARDFVLMKEREKKTYSNNSAVLFGYPNYDGNSTVSTDSLDFLATTRDLDPMWVDSLTRGGMTASPLPATKTEIENISSTFGKHNWDVSTYLENDASETNIKKAKSPRLLHIATHGYFFEDIPMDYKNDRFMGMNRQQVIQDPMLRSGLLFTGANKTLQGEKVEGENGLLSAYEAALLDLSETELVVLSACETGRGEVKNSEGVYGLRKAISDAGAANTIMSLWKVDDKVTQEFMSTFYEEWLSGLTIRKAFRKTRLTIKEKYPQPYYWGAFVLVGG